MSRRKTTVSLQKIIDLLHRNSFGLTATFCEGASGASEVKFLQVKTPNIQKTFVISIPSRYIVKNTVDSHRRFHIGKFGNVPSKQIDYLTDLKGSRLECDLVAISSTTIYLYRNNGDNEGYLIGEAAIAELKKHSRVAADTPETGSDPVEKLVRDTKFLARNLGSDEDSDGELSPEDLKKMKVFGKTTTVVLDTETDDEISELCEGDIEEDANEESEEGGNADEESEGSDFANTRIHKNDGDDPAQDEESSDEYPSESEYPARTSGRLEKPTLEESLEEAEDQDIVFESAPKHKKKSHRKDKKSGPRRAKKISSDNSLPLHIDEADLEIGIIYVSIDLSTFYTRVSAPSFENDILKIYDTLDANEMEMRDLRTKEIAELSLKISEKVKTEMDLFRAADLKNKSQMIRLTESLKKLETLSIRVNANPSKFADSKAKIERMKENVKNTFDDLNLDGLRLRDLANDTLGHYLTCLEDMIGFQPNFGNLSESEKRPDASHEDVV